MPFGEGETSPQLSEDQVQLRLELRSSRVLLESEGWPAPRPWAGVYVPCRYLRTFWLLAYVFSKRPQCIPSGRQWSSPRQAQCFRGAFLCRSVTPVLGARCLMPSDHIAVNQPIWALRHLLSPELGPGLFFPPAPFCPETWAAALYAQGVGCLLL